MHPFTHGLMVAGSKSGCGKTTLALGLLCALARRGLRLQACKTGPDFLDPTHHAAITQRPSYSIDTWMGEIAGLAPLYARLCQQPADMLIAEGVMGLFDGAHGLGGRGSTAHLAQTLGLPILLVIDVRGMGQSAVALAAGYIHAMSLRFMGIVCSHVGGQGHQEMLREAFAHESMQDLPPLLGLLPRKDVPPLASRHLGVVMAHECPWDTVHQAMWADWCETYIDIDQLITHCALACTPGVCTSLPTPAPTRNISLPTASRPRIAIAHDEAFCFLYPDMPEVLKEEGADIVYFSPLRDAMLPPDCAAVYIPGGYPELYAEQLANNTSLRAHIHSLAAHGTPIYGECGGYMYLMQYLHVQEATYPLCGCLPLQCQPETQRVALGYREVRPVPQSLFAGNTCARARGHEFHYARIVGENTMPPLWEVVDRKHTPLPPEGSLYKNVAGSWIHLYPEGARDILYNFILGCRHALLI